VSTSLYARHKRTTLAIATAVAAGALLTTGMTSGTSAAADSPSKPALAAAPVLLSAPARTALIKEQQADATGTADEIGLGEQEKLVVRDVVKDADGTVHTRYERTYAGLPVLGGDLVVHESKSGVTKGVTRATKAKLEVDSLKPAVTAAKAEKQAVTLAKAAGSEKTEADSAPR
jgi:Zn-dependent metalloprotease